MLRFTGILLVLIFGVRLFAQDISDSVFVLKAVEVSSDRIFVKESAGMKESSVDTLILLQKINLSLTDVLAENTPVFIKSYGRGALATASFRGTAESHTQVNWNGISINTPMAGMVDFSLIPVYIIDDLSLKYGSASIADKSGGLGGSVNIKNTVDWNNRVGVKLMQGIGSYGTYDEFLQLSLGSSKFQAKTRAYYSTSQNDYTFVNKGIAEINPETGAISHPVDTNKNAAYSRYGFLQEFYYKPDNKNSFAARWWYQNADRSIPQATSYEGPTQSGLNNQKDEDHKIAIDYKHYGQGYRLLLRSGFSGKEMDYSLRNFVPGVGAVPAIFSQSSQQSFVNTASLIYDFTESFSLETAVDLNYHKVSSHDTVAKTGYERNRNELSYFLALRKGFADRLNLNLMLRQEWTDNTREPLVPYFGFDFKLLSAMDLFIKGNLARNYHLPSLNDLYWQPGGNPQLEAEEGMSYELGLDYHFKIQKLKLHSELTAFYSDINNWIAWIPTYKGYWQPQNIKNVVARGVEFNLNLKGRSGKLSYVMAANYAFTQSINYGDPEVWGDASYGKQLVFVPIHSGNIMLSLAWKNFHVSWQHNSYSERFTTTTNDVSSRYRFYPYFMNDLIVGKDFQIGKIGLSAAFKIYNLFDENYRSVLARPMPGRNFLFTLMFNY